MSRPRALLLRILGGMPIPAGDCFTHPLTNEYWITVRRSNEHSVYNYEVGVRRGEVLGDK